MPIIRGIEAAPVEAEGSKAEIVILTGHEDPDFVRAALDIRALGYVVKVAHRLSDLPNAIRGGADWRIIYFTF